MFCVSEIVICECLMGLVSFETNVSKTAGQIHEIELVYRDDLSLDWAIMCDVRGIKAFTSEMNVTFAFKTQVEVCLKIKWI